MPGQEVQQRDPSRVAPAFSDETMRMFVEQQARELETRQRELALEERRETYNHEYALKALDAQVEDRRENRKGYGQVLRDRYWFVGALVFIASGLVATLALSGQGDLALELVKAILYVTTAGAGGYFLGKGRSPKPNDE